MAYAANNECVWLAPGVDIEKAENSQIIMRSGSTRYLLAVPNCPDLNFEDNIGIPNEPRVSSAPEITSLWVEISALLKVSSAYQKNN